MRIVFVVAAVAFFTLVLQGGERPQPGDACVSNRDCGGNGLTCVANPVEQDGVCVAGDTARATCQYVCEQDADCAGVQRPACAASACGGAKTCATQSVATAR